MNSPIHLTGPRFLLLLAFNSAVAVFATQEKYSTPPHSRVPVTSTPVHHRVRAVQSSPPTPASSSAYPSSTATFDASFQRVNVTGAHSWHPAGPNDQRGPCPGINALANHGYLPRNGSATAFELAEAVNSVFGMAFDVATLLGSYSAVFDGDGVGTSIGGGVHTGISGSRGNLESDGSPTRGDLNQYGSNVDLVVSQFKTLYDMQPDAATANYDMDVLTKFKAIRWQESIDKNPYFYLGPMSGGIVVGVYALIYRLFANHTEAHPEGILNKDVLKSFFGVSESSTGKLTWTSGQERIPDNWYRRSRNDEYGLAGLGADTGAIAAHNPQYLMQGCNQGKVNTFITFNSSSIDPADYNTSDPTYKVCYALAQSSSGPDAAMAAEVLIPIQDAIGCKTVQSLNKTIAQACPGYSLYGGPKGPIAPGAIQS